ncbi:DNA-binding protein [bacterium]|nr:DNA-binding protein [bacterium]|tara:strand:+ start:13678 stop:14100 length:423 start_codon:yes stop_codon:yes gene_type:complete
MQYKKFNDKYILRLDKGEEVVGTLKKFCQEKSIKLASISGIGASNKIELGLFNTREKKYYSRALEQDFEISSLIGNITEMDGKVYLHLHITLGDKDQNTFSGHLNSAIISGTCEIIIHAINGEVDRKFSNEIGLNLLEFN